MIPGPIPGFHPHPVPCACCNEPIDFVPGIEIWREPNLGFVCESCKKNLIKAVAYLKFHKIYPCKEPPDERMVNA